MGLKIVLQVPKGAVEKLCQRATGANTTPEKMLEQALRTLGVQAIVSLGEEQEKASTDAPRSVQ